VSWCGVTAASNGPAATPGDGRVPACRRGTRAEAAQEKLSVIAEALAALMASRAVQDRKLEEG
jgi:hypothetical protein